MNERCKSVLKDYRERAGFKQEDAAERLNISPHTLYNYEAFSHGTRRNMPPDEIILKMSELYIVDDDPVRERLKRDYMKILYLKDTNLIFESMFSSIEALGLPMAFLRHQVEHEDVKRLEEPARRMVIDNKIDESETDFAGLFVKELMECTVSSMSLICSVLEKTPVAAASAQPKKQKLKRRAIHGENERTFAAW